LGVRIPWRVDGHSLLGSRPAERDVVLIKDHGRRFTIPQGRLEALRERALRRQLALFGSDEPVSKLLAIGPDRGLLGLKALGARPPSSLTDGRRSLFAETPLPSPLVVVRTAESAIPRSRYPPRSRDDPSQG